MPRLTGAGAALDMLWSSRKVEADETLRLGMVQPVVAADAREGAAVLMEKRTPAWAITR